MTPEPFAIFAMKEALAYLETEHRNEQTMLIREMLQRALKQMGDKYGHPEFPKRVEVLA